jgi:hypothetical protein
MPVAAPSLTQPLKIAESDDHRPIRQRDEALLILFARFLSAGRDVGVLAVMILVAHKRL